MFWELHGMSMNYTCLWCCFVFPLYDHGIDGFGKFWSALERPGRSCKVLEDV